MIISIGNEKGGVAKTTLSMTLAVGLAEKGYKVLLMDLDQQMNLTDSMYKRNEVKLSSADILINGASVKDCIVESKGVYFVPGADDELKSADIKIKTSRPLDGGNILKKALAVVKDDYDFIILDTPRGSGMVTLNAFVASDRVLIATIPEVYALTGIMDIAGTITEVREWLGSQLKIDGIVISKYKGSTNNHKDLKEAIEEIAESLGVKVYKSIIRESTLVGTAQKFRQSVIEMDKRSEVAKDYYNFIDEFLEGVK